MVEASRIPRIAVAGADGRMGQAVADMVRNQTGTEPSALFDRLDRPGLVSRDVAMHNSDVIIDFTNGAASAELARLSAARGGPALVIGSTGFSPDEDRRVREASQSIAIIRSGNFSLGINLLLGLVRQAASALPAEDWDIEILESHHARKVDSPSGTALMLGQAAAEGRDIALNDHMAPPRQGIGAPRQAGDIGFAVLRAGGIIGEHSVYLASQEETLVLSHSARDRSLFARGAVRAALWIADRPPGLYDMQDLLGLKS
jgi:4-hydroxy-tetrahydrodipicolinate reductase